MIGEPTHTASEKAPRAPAISIIVSKVKYPLLFVVSYVQPVTRHFESRTVRKAPLQSTHTKRNRAACPNYINYRLKSEVSVTLRCRLCSTPLHSSTNQELFEKHLCNRNSHDENTDDFRFKGKPSRARAKSTPFPVSKDEWDTKEDTGKAMNNALHVLRYAKRHLSGRSDVEQ